MSSPALFVRVPRPIHERVLRVAEEHGSTGPGWVTALLVNVILGEPLLRRDELLALNESNRAMWAKVTSLNQIAAVMQQRARAVGAPISGDGQAAIELLRQCQRDIKQHAKTVNDLLARAAAIRAGRMVLV